jgi:hypothetical protein
LIALSNKLKLDLSCRYPCSRPGVELGQHLQLAAEMTVKWFSKVGEFSTLEHCAKDSWLQVVEIKEQSPGERPSGVALLHLEPADLTLQVGKHWLCF